MDFDQLSQYEIENELQFVEIEHGFVYAEINNAKAHATISTYSGQVLSYQPKNQQDSNFCSQWYRRKFNLQTGRGLQPEPPIFR